MPHPQVLSASNAAHVEAACAAHGLALDEFRALRRHADGARGLAYCPYSGFSVGAALLTRPGGAYVTGANVENASYPVGTCAERVALGRALMDGHRTGGFKALAVSTGASPPCSPCGMCRQFIREFCDVDFPILMFDQEGSFVAMKLGDLLPLSFGPEALEKFQQAAARG